MSKTSKKPRNAATVKVEHTPVATAVPDASSPKPKSSPVAVASTADAPAAAAAQSPKSPAPATPVVASPSPRAASAPTVSSPSGAGSATASAAAAAAESDDDDDDDVDLEHDAGEDDDDTDDDLPPLEHAPDAPAPADESKQSAEDEEVARQLAAAEAKELGNEAYKRGDYAEAETLYSKAVALCPSDATYYANRAAARMMLNQLQGVIDDCMSTTRLDPTHVKAFLRLGKAHLKLVSTPVLPLRGLWGFSRRASPVLRLSLHPRESPLPLAADCGV